MQRFGLKAVEIIRAEGWRTDIIAETARRLMTENTHWRDSYKLLIGADPYEKCIKAKERINAEEISKAPARRRRRSGTRISRSPSPCNKRGAGRR